MKLLIMTEPCLVAAKFEPKFTTCLMHVIRGFYSCNHLFLPPLIFYLQMIFVKLNIRICLLYDDKMNLTYWKQYISFIKFVWVEKYLLQESIQIHNKGPRVTWFSTIKEAVMNTLFQKWVDPTFYSFFINFLFLQKIMLKKEGKIL